MLYVSKVLKCEGCVHVGSRVQRVTLTDPERLPPCKPPQPAHVSSGAHAGQAAVEPDTDIWTESNTHLATCVMLCLVSEQLFLLDQC